MECYTLFENTEKPKFLYHGDRTNRLSKLTPEVSSGSGEKYGKQVYATENKAYASMYMCNIKKPWSAGHYGNNSVLVAKIPYTREEFMERDNGGTIYTVPSASFQKNGEEDEWMSSDAVETREGERYDSALETMLSLGVQVYFIDDETMKKLRESESGGIEILKTLESENQRRDYNVRLFE